jgi:predicted deacylase
MQEPFEICNVRVEPGDRQNIDIPLARLYTHTQMTLPVEVLHGTESGPRLFLSATLHGDEINGIEIIRRVMAQIGAYGLKGTVVAVPIINVFGFVYQSRYLPDRRDLNRSFPGSSRGSLASRLAYLFCHEVMYRCTHGIDLHTAAPPRTNLPQVRANLKDKETRRIAEAFAAPVMMGSPGPEGSMRRVAVKRGIPLLVYEGGEPHRFNETTIEMGVNGVLRVMRALEMVDEDIAPAVASSIESTRTTWVRARQSGILRLEVAMGELVVKGQQLGIIADPFGSSALPVIAPQDGMVIGQVISPLVHRGDAVLHLAINMIIIKEDADDSAQRAIALGYRQA